MLLAAASNWSSYEVLLYILESKRVNWRFKVFLSWNMHNHDLWSKCACAQIYEFQLESWGSEWGYKLITENISPNILTDYWDLRMILADYWWWISKYLTDYWELAKKFTACCESTKKLTGLLLRTGYPHSSPPELCLYSFVSDCKVIINHCSYFGTSFLHTIRGQVSHLRGIWPLSGSLGGRIGYWVQ